MADAKADVVHGLVTRAAAFEAKWAEIDLSTGMPVFETVPILNVGVHVGNRGGVYTQGMACKSLLHTILKVGFDKEEANHGGVAVRERPHNVTSAEETIHDFNIRSSEGDQYLSGSYVDGDQLTHGVIAHCHLLNLCRAIKRALKWGDVEKGVCDSEGCLSATALAGHPGGAAWAEYLQHGITFKVLRWDTPRDVAATISAARNKATNAAIAEHEWTALRQLNGIAIIDSTALAEEVYAKYLERAVSLLGQDVTEKPLTGQLIEMVHKFGPGSKFVDELCVWSTKMVNSKIRRGSYELFKKVNELPKTAPYSKMALLMRQYSSPNVTDTIVPTPPAGWSSVPHPMLTVLENFLRYLRQEAVDTALADVIQGNAAEKVKQLYRTQTTITATTINAFEAMAIKAKGTCTVAALKEQLALQVGAVMRRHGTKLEQLPTPSADMSWIDFTEKKGDDTNAFEQPKAKAKGRPKNPDKAKGVVQVPKSFEKALSNKRSVDADSLAVVVEDGVGGSQEDRWIKVPWQYWHTSPHYHAQGMSTSLDYTAAIALRVIHQEADLSGLPIDIVTGGKKGYKVFANRDIEKGALLIPPSVSSKMKVVRTTTNQHASPVIVCHEAVDDYELVPMKDDTAPDSKTLDPAPAAAHVSTEANTALADAAAPTVSEGSGPDKTADDDPPDGTGDEDVATPRQHGWMGDANAAAEKEECKHMLNGPRCSSEVELLVGDRLEDKHKRMWTITAVGSESVAVEAPKTGAKGQLLKTPQKDTIKIADIKYQYRVYPLGLKDTPVSPGTVTIAPGEKSYPKVDPEPPKRDTALADVSTQAGTGERDASGHTQPMARVAVKRKKYERMYILPENEFPEHHDVGGDDGDIKWKFARTTAIHPFWVVRRMAKSEAALAQATADVARQKKQSQGKQVENTPAVKTNCKFTDHSVSMTTGGVFDSKGFYDGRRVTYKCITNTEHILSGNEIVVEIEPLMPDTALADDPYLDVDDTPADIVMTKRSIDDCMQSVKRRRV